MDILSADGLPATTLTWQMQNGRHALTIVCKATLELQPLSSALADSHEPLHEADVHTSGDPGLGVFAPSDLVPLKPRADVLLVGHAFAPRGAPVRSLVARLVVGDLDKSIEVIGDRAVSDGGAVSEPAPFVKMPLVYERAAGGPGTWNPAGVGPGRAILPNLQPLGARAGELVQPIGFGPMGRDWPLRHNRSGLGASSPADLRGAMLPLDLDFGCFNAAPPDQQLITLRGDEQIVLENLHPELRRLNTRLPGLAPHATVELPGGAQQTELRCDTLWIDTDRGLVTLTFRAQIPLDRPDTRGRVVIEMNRPASLPSGATIPISSAMRSLGPALPFPTMHGAPPPDRAPHADGFLPFSAPPMPKGPEPIPPPLLVPAPVPPTFVAVLAPMPPAPVRTVGQAAVEDGHGAGAPAIEADRAIESAATRAHPAVEILWHNPAALPRLRRRAAWKELLADVKPRPEDEDLEDDLPQPRRTSPRDRREILTLLMRGEAIDADGVGAKLAQALDDEHGFTPTLELVSGDLELCFDELETLKATLAAVSPFAAIDAKLKETVADVQEIFKVSWVQGAGGVIEDLTSRVRSAFALVHGKKPGAEAQLEAHVTRALIDQRHYRKRTAFGQPRLRALLSSQGSRARVPVYLPEGIAKELPALRRFGARLIGEVRPGVEEGEDRVAVVRAVVLGRVVG